MFKIGGETPGLARTLFSVPALAPGETFQVQRQATLIAQNYRNTATADFTGVVSETNETNNTTTDDYTVSPGLLLVRVLPETQGNTVADQR